MDERASGIFKENSFIGFALICLAAALWATVGVARGLTHGVADLDPATVGLVRTVLGAAFVLAFALHRGIGSGWKEIPLGALAVFGIAGAIFQVCLFNAFALVGVTATVAITVCAPPLIVAIGEAVWGRRMPRVSHVAAILIASLGVVLLCGLPAAGAATDFVGILAVLGASFAFAALAVAARTVGRRLNPLRGTGLGLGSTALVLASVVALGEGAGVSALSGLDVGDLLVLIYIGAVATGGAYLAFVVGMRHCATAGAGLTATMLEPVVAAALAAALLEERLGLLAWLGCALTLAAIVVVFIFEPGTRISWPRRPRVAPEELNRGASES